MVLQFLSVIGLSGLKMIPGLALAVVYEMTQFQIFLSLAIGGVAGVVAFSLLAMPIRNWRKRKRREKMKTSTKPLKIKKARKIVKLWKKYGLVGIAILTPPVVSPPIGSFIAVAFGEKFVRILLYMIPSVLVWSALFALLGDWFLALLH
ncbi:MAG: hypothetical protein AAF570_00265 [Bacteroidota bacterium]